MRTLAALLLAATLLTIPAIAFAEFPLWISAEYQLEDGTTIAVVEGTDWEVGGAILAIMYFDGEEVIVDEVMIDSPDTDCAVVRFLWFQPGNEVAYRGPAGEVPPDSREPSDPPPPPEGGGPTTPGGDCDGPTTGG